MAGETTADPEADLNEAGEGEGAVAATAAAARGVGVPAGSPPPTPPRRRTALYSAVALGVTVALLVGVLATRQPSSTRLADSPLLGRPAPALAGPSVLEGGGDFDLVDQRGRWTLVNFFATWCVPCRAEHPDLLRFSAAHAAAGDARLVSVVFSDDRDDVARFFTERGGDWPVLDDPVGRVALDFGVTGVPESYLIGPDGTVAAKVIGGIDFDKLADLLARAQAGPEGGS
ncbi:MAG: TlpA family protein disulfide reductase [Acidimicrobiales bacterium]